MESPESTGREPQATFPGPRAAISRWFDALLAAIGDWLDGPSRTPLPDPAASRRRN